MKYLCIFVIITVIPFGSRPPSCPIHVAGRGTWGSLGALENVTIVKILKGKYRGLGQSKYFRKLFHVLKSCIYYLLEVLYLVRVRLWWSVCVCGGGGGGSLVYLPSWLLVKAWASLDTSDSWSLQHMIVLHWKHHTILFLFYINQSALCYNS